MTTRDLHNSRPGRSSSWITKHRRLAIYMRDLFTCMYCGRDLRGVSRREITLDHLRCRIDGGSNDSSNLITACLSCNSGRSAHTKWYKYATPGAVKRIRAHIRRRLNIQLAKDIIAGRANLDAETR